MKPRRDRFGPVMFLVMAALMLFALFGTPGVQGEVDTGPRLVAVLETLSHPPAIAWAAVIVDMVDQAEGLNVYFAEDELRIEVSSALASPAEGTRYESGHRSGVGKRSNEPTSFDSDMERIAGRPRATPLRC